VIDSEVAVWSQSVLCWQDCELAELRLTVDKLHSSASLHLPPSLAACSSSSPPANIAAAAAGLCVCLSVSPSVCAAGSVAFICMLDIVSDVRETLRAVVLPIL